MDKGEELDIPTLFEIMKDKSDLTYREAEKLQEDLRLKKEGVCITGALKKDLSKDLQARVKELENSLSIALEINESHQRYNGKLQTRVTDLEEDNKKLTKQINDHIKKYEDTFRKAGL